MCHVCQTYPSVEVSTQRIGENAEECVQLFGYNNITRPLSCFSLETQNALRKQSARKTHTSESKSGESDDPNGFMGGKGHRNPRTGIGKTVPQLLKLLRPEKLFPTSPFFSEFSVTAQNQIQIPIQILLVYPNK